LISLINSIAAHTTFLAHIRIPLRLDVTRLHQAPGVEAENIKQPVPDRWWTNGGQHPYRVDVFGGGPISGALHMIDQVQNMAGPAQAVAAWSFRGSLRELRREAKGVDVVRKAW